MSDKRIVKENLLVLCVVLLGIAIWLVFSTNRFTITGTNKGYAYKTDKLTGKTTIISSKGEFDINDLPSAKPAPTPKQFPTSYLQILSIKSPTVDRIFDYAEVEVKNLSTALAASQIKFKITYKKTATSQPFDTEYYDSFDRIGPGDTVTYSVLLKDLDYEYWYDVEIESATEE